MRKMVKKRPDAPGGKKEKEKTNVGEKTEKK